MIFSRGCKNNNNKKKCYQLNEKDEKKIKKKD